MRSFLCLTIARVLLSRAYSFSSRFRRVAIINFVAVQMKIDKNGRIDRKQLRGRSGCRTSSCSNKQGTSVASFFGKPQTTSLDSLTRSSVLDHASTRANSPTWTSSPKLDRRFRAARPRRKTNLAQRFAKTNGTNA